jgi:DNA-binding MarR family transcriptional regulator
VPQAETLEGFRQAGVESQLGFLTTSFSHMARKYLLSQLQDKGLDAGLKIDELPIMARIFEQPGLPQAELNRLTLKDKTTVTRLLAALERKKLIIRKVDNEDRRARKVYLSPRGEQLIGDFAPIAMAMQQALFNDIPAADIETTKRTMKLLYQRIAGQTEPEGK